MEEGGGRGRTREGGEKEIGTQRRVVEGSIIQLQSDSTKLKNATSDIHVCSVDLLARLC